MTIYSTNNQLQYALFQAAKVGNIKLMREFIAADGDPFALDKENNNAIFYAKIQDPVKTEALLLELADIAN